MAEAAILGTIQDMESSLSTCTDKYDRGDREAIIKELREILDFLRDLKMEERSRLKYLVADLVEMAQDLMEIEYNYLYKIFKKEIEIIKMRMINFGADEKNASEEEAEVVVGLEEDVNNMVYKRLLHRGHVMTAWCIKGMTGIGKTTLARQVYNHEVITGLFEPRAWVSFSSDMSNKEVLVELIQQMVVGGDAVIVRDSLLEEKDNRSLRQMLRRHLKGKRFFIVVDNLLKGMQLDHMLRDFQDGMCIFLSFLFIL